jgi:hypothetical protein
MTTKGQRQQYTFSEIVDEEDSELLENYLTDVSTRSTPSTAECPGAPVREKGRAPVHLCARARSFVLGADRQCEYPGVPKVRQSTPVLVLCFRS